MLKQIISPQNNYIKELLKLQEKSRERKKSGLFLIEGLREISLAKKGNYVIDTLLFCPELLPFEQIVNLKDNKTNLIEITIDVYKKLAYRDSTEGIIGVAKTKEFSLKNVVLNNKKPLILVAEAPEKPGNIGALLRTADAAGVDAVIIANLKTDIFNPNIVRSSVGCLFTTNIAIGTTSEIISFLKEKNIHIYGADLTASVEYQTIDYSKSSAIVVGTEATGLTEEWLQNTTQNIIIPMHGTVDSMNVSVSAAIIIFEAVRQRKLILES